MARPWESLSPAYRHRLIGAGRRRGLSEADVRALHEGGGDVRSLRGHAPKNPHGAPAELVAKELAGQGDTSDYSRLQQWRRSLAPAWIPRSESTMGTDTAAILSQIPRGPSQWSRVTIGRADADGHYPLTVKPKRGYATTVLLTDGEMVSEVARFLRSPLSAATTPAEKRRLERAFRNARFHVAIDTDSAKVAPGGDEGPPPPAPTGTTRALKASVPGKKAPKKAAPKRSPAKKKAAPKKAAKKAPKKARRAPAKKASFGELVGQAVADAATTAETGLVELADTLADELTPAQLQRVIERLQRRLT